jgi:histidine triad (HIT) family protein
MANPNPDFSDCPFCRIAAGTLPCGRVDETENVLAFRDLAPQAPTHVLLIPKRHVAESAADLDVAHAGLLAEMFHLAARVARSEGLARGWRLVTNVGGDGGQTIRHLHLHLLGGRPMRWPPG